MRNVISYFPKGELSLAADLFRKRKNVVFSGAGNASSKAMILSDIVRREGVFNGNVVWVVSEDQEQNVVKKALEIWGDKEVFLYSKRLDEEVLSFSTMAEFERVKKLELIEFILRLRLYRGAVFVLSFHSLLQNFPDFSELDFNKVGVKEGDSFDVVEFIEKLVSIGYEVSDARPLDKGGYYRIGDSIVIKPINSEYAHRIDFGFDKIESVVALEDDGQPEVVKKVKSLDVFPLDCERLSDDFFKAVGNEGLIIDDEVDVVDEYYEPWNSFMEEASNACSTISFSSFNDDVENHMHLHFLSVLKYRTAYDFANDLRDKISAGWNTMVFTKNVNDIRALFADQSIPFMVGIDEEKFKSSSVFIVEVQKEDTFPQSFQAPVQKINLLTDVDVSFLREEKKRVTSRNIFDDFLTSLKVGYYVVHADHGIAKFMGLDKKTVDGITKEYLKLGYAENDKLFVPIDQADKVNKYIGSEDLMPKLTRLGSAEWNTITNKVRKETQKIAKELLKLYAEKRTPPGFSF